MSKLYAALSSIKEGSMPFSEILLYYSDIPVSYLLYETAKKKKEGNKMAKIFNQPTLDLRNFSPDALKKIQSITNVASILLPEHMTPEFSEAYAAIKKTNIAAELNIPGDALLYNGDVTLTRNNVTKNSMVICNGNLIVKDIPPELNLKINLNGTLIKSSDAFVQIVKINGTVHEIDKDVYIIKSMAKLKIDVNFINNLPEKTAIIACGKVDIESAVTEAMLRSKALKFYAVGKIRADKELHGYIQANSNSVGKIVISDEPEKKKAWWKK